MVILFPCSLTRQIFPEQVLRTPGPYHGPGSTNVVSISCSFPNVFKEHVLLFSGNIYIYNFFFKPGYMFYPSGRQQGNENLLVGEERVWGHGCPAGGSRNYSYLRRKLAPQKGTPHPHPREQSHSPGNRGVRHPQVDTCFSPRRPAPQRAPSAAEEEKVLETRNHSEQMLLV